MHRDMDLIRQMLKDVESQAEPVGIKAWEGPHSHEVVGYHIRLLGESGLARVTVVPAGDDPYHTAAVDSLTWAGHDLLDSIASDGIWARVKRELMKVGGGATVAIVQQVAQRMVLQQLGM